MFRNNRREFLSQVGQAMLLAGIGPELAFQLGTSRALADGDSPKLNFGSLEPLAALMQDTPADKLLPILVEKIRGGAALDELVAGCALANARTFGGEDYVGFHSFMALAPASVMARQLPTELAPLPVLKVIYRNVARMQETGGREHEVLHPVSADASAQASGEALREATRRGDFGAAETAFAALMQSGNDPAYNELQLPIEDEDDVHRVVLAWRAWSTLDLTGHEHAHTLLRQCVRYCCNSEVKRGNRPVNPIRELLPKLLDEHKLLDKPIGQRDADDAWIAEFTRTIFASSKEQAAAAAAMALAEGMSPAALGEAISLAATRLILWYDGRPEKHANASAGMPVGSVHGASVGVHASDSANAWRNIAAATNPRNTVASLILAAYHTAGQTSFMRSDEFPFSEKEADLADLDQAKLLAEAETAIRAGDQPRICAVVDHYGTRQFSERPLFDLFLKYSTSEDGALHAEKYYCTISEEFARTRPALRWQHAVALGRVIASEHGRPAPGYLEARELLGLAKA